MEEDTRSGRGIFRPTLEEMKDITSLVRNLRKECTKQIIGAAHIITPKEWAHRSKFHDFESCDRMINRPVEQDHHRKGSDQYYVSETSKTPIRVGDYMIEGANNTTYLSLSESEKRKKYWSNVHNRKIVYGAGVEGTLFDDDLAIW